MSSRFGPYIRVYPSVVEKCGLVSAVFLAYLVDQYEYHKQPTDFYVARSNIKDYLGLEREQQQRCEEKLKDYIRIVPKYREANRYQFLVDVGKTFPKYSKSQPYYPVYLGIVKTTSVFQAAAFYGVVLNQWMKTGSVGTLVEMPRKELKSKLGLKDARTWNVYIGYLDSDRYLSLVGGKKQCTITFNLLDLPPKLKPNQNKTAALAVAPHLSQNKAMEIAGDLLNKYNAAMGGLEFRNADLTCATEHVEELYEIEDCLEPKSLDWTWFNLDKRGKERVSQKFLSAFVKFHVLEIMQENIERLRLDFKDSCRERITELFRKYRRHMTFPYYVNEPYSGKVEVHPTKDDLKSYTLYRITQPHDTRFKLAALRQIRENLTEEDGLMLDREAKFFQRFDPGLYHSRKVTDFPDLREYTENDRWHIVAEAAVDYNAAFHIKSCYRDFQIVNDNVGDVWQIHELFYPAALEYIWENYGASLDQSDRSLATFVNSGLLDAVIIEQHYIKKNCPKKPAKEPYIPIPRDLSSDDRVSLEGCGVVFPH